MNDRQLLARIQESVCAQIQIEKEILLAIIEDAGKNVRLAAKNLIDHLLPDVVDVDALSDQDVQTLIAQVKYTLGLTGQRAHKGPPFREEIRPYAC